jgi:outer membrane protein OmpA-like peptidoglycan-associated protein
MISRLRQVLLVISLLSIAAAHAQTTEYYVVIGAFAKESNAKKFTGFARSRFFQATYELNPGRNLFYVYVLKTTTKPEAVDKVLVLRREETFKDCWVFTGTLGTQSQTTPVVSAIEGTPEVQSSKPEISIPAPDSSVVAETILTPTVPEKEPEVKTANETVARKAKGKFFKFTILTPSGEPLAGKVHHVDLKQARDIASYTSNEYSDVPRPSSSSRDEPMTIVCGIFGYQEITQLVDYANPGITTGAVQDENGVWTIPFKLERLKKGDVSVMYDVSFYKDAVVMLPRSQEELDELVNLMTSNPNYKIKIHGHANGNGKQKIIVLGKSKNYFDIKGSKQKNGTAKELSKERAQAVSDYLTEHGIAQNRMEVFAWGGTNMLVAETSPSAKLNDRIEIEILED